MVMMAEKRRWLTQSKTGRDIGCVSMCALHFPRPQSGPNRKRSSVAGTVGPGKFRVSCLRFKDATTSVEVLDLCSAIDFLPVTNGHGHRVSKQPRFFDRDQRSLN